MPKFRKPKRGARAVPHTLSAPTGGLNGRDALNEQAPNDAYRMENWIPSNTSVDTRGGSSDYGTGVPAAVESLETYTGGAGSKMLAFGNGEIYDVTLGGAVGAALASGKISNKVTTTMFSNAGSQFLLIFSGADQPLSFDGTTLTGLTITGMTGSQDTLHSPHAFKARVYLAQEDQLGFYYLGVGAIQGAATFFDLQQQCFKGGSLATITSFSQDSGNGPADYIVFATTEGEYVVYSGTDPSSAAAWQIVGRYYGPAPLGKKGWFRFRSDVYFITEEGILSFTEIREGSEDRAKYLTDKLGRLFKDAVQYRDTHGWCGLVYPRGGLLFVNVPLTSATSGGYTQFALNTSTKDTWTQFYGWDALCWTMLDKRAYFGTSDGRIVLADDGFTDNGDDITCSCSQAWNTFDDENGMGEGDKQFHGVIFAVSADGAPALAATLNVNYEDFEPTITVPAVAASGSEWDVSDWDVADWAGAASTQNLSISVGKLGYIASIRMRAVSRSATMRWFASRIVMEKTKGVLFQ